jgi:hypothetical protein
LPGKVLLLNIIGIILQYTLVILLYYFLFRVLKLVYIEFKGATGQHHAVHIAMPADGRPEEAPAARLVAVDTGQVALNQPVVALGEVVSIGRGDGNDIVINDSFVSHEHACISRYKQGYWLADLHSTNGTYLNNERVKEEVQLHKGDLVRIGAVTFRFER